MVIDSVQFVIFLPENFVAFPAIQAGSHIFPGWFPKSFNEISSEQSVAVYSDSGFDITVSSQPGRHDVIVSHPSPGNRLGLGPSIDLQVVRQQYETPLAAFAKKVGAVRVAVVAKAITSVASQQAAVAHIGAILPQIHLPVGANEVDFKINVPKHFKAAPNLTMNRLRRWQTAGIVMLLIGPNGPKPTETQWASLEEVDFSTDVHGRIDPNQMDSLVSELFEEAVHQLGRGIDGLESLLDD